MNVVRTVCRCVCGAVGVLALAVGLLTAPIRPAHADPGDPQNKCPGKFDDKGVYLGCEHNDACKLPTKQGVCGDAPGGKNCNCNPVGT